MRNEIQKQADRDEIIRRLNAALKDRGSARMPAPSTLRRMRALIADEYYQERAEAEYIESQRAQAIQAVMAAEDNANTLDLDRMLRAAYDAGRRDQRNA